MNEPLSQCPYCGSSLRPSLRFCEQCGAELQQTDFRPISSSDSAAPVTAGKFPPPEPALNDAPSPKPNLTGTPQQEPQSAQVGSPPLQPAWISPPEQPHRKRRSGLWITCLILIIILCLLAICGGVSFLLIAQPNFLSSLGIF